MVRGGLTRISSRIFKSEAFVCWAPDWPVASPHLLQALTTLQPRQLLAFIQDNNHEVWIRRCHTKWYWTSFRIDHAAGQKVSLSRIMTITSQGKPYNKYGPVSSTRIVLIVVCKRARLPLERMYTVFLPQGAYIYRTGNWGISSSARHPVLTVSTISTIQSCANSSSPLER